METLEVIKKRRSIRNFLDKEVEQEKIEKIIEAGLWAPSAANRQPWKIVVIKNQGIIDELKKVSVKAFEEYTKEKLTRLYPKHPIVVKSTGTFSENFGNAKVLLAIFNEKLENEHETLLGMQSVCALIQNILLAVEDLGLGACWMSDIILYSDTVCGLLNIDPQLYALTALIPIGYPVSPAKPIPRKENRVLYL